MKFEDSQIKEILLKGNYATEADLAHADDYAKVHHVSILEYLLSEGLLSRALLGQAIAEHLGVPYTDLSNRQISEADASKIPADLAASFHLVFVSEDKKSVTVATDDPSQKGLAEDLKKIFGAKKITTTFSLTEDIDSALTIYHKKLDTRFSKIIAGDKRIAPEIIEEILSDALSFRASDIHFEPQRTEVLVRFRVDGILQEAGRIPREYYENILNRIKVESRLRIDEHFAAQDGSMRYQKNDLVVDLRTSIVPTVEGEKVVLRVLSAYVEGLNLSDLGLSEMHQIMLEKAAKKPFGMILVTGPTGSGKTTTLYALLKLLNNPGANITTIEDPVEYKVLGVNQIQVNTETNLTFAQGLRSIVRQDPDIILVGEIRDKETTEISVNAALTGHLLLSTFHANDAATAIPRLLDMGTEPFLLASTLEIIIAQRLVRKICNNCRHSVAKNSKDLKHVDIIQKFFGKKKITLYEGKGCEVCAHTGFKGRTAIFEFIQVTPEMQELVLKSPSTQEIWELARKQGSTSLFEDGIDKVKNGVTTIDELLRVAEPPVDHKK